MAPSIGDVAAARAAARDGSLRGDTAQGGTFGRVP